MADRILKADSPQGPIFACVSPGTRITEPLADFSRLGATLRPFADEESARAALAAAVGELDGA